MQDVAFIGLTVIFFIAMALLGAGVDRLGRRYGVDADAASADAASADAAVEAPARPEVRP
ncbi:hypothetical protein [Jiangella endophytica]|uniref:hypothetical protein n=1 Tax=Jiangella endophytica TaxID=1623398 RepID=UPI000E3446AE|nr:hypothetical protein [Jiangella endophytica]